MWRHGAQHHGASPLLAFLQSAGDDIILLLHQFLCESSSAFSDTLDCSSVNPRSRFLSSSFPCLSPPCAPFPFFGRLGICSRSFFALEASPGLWPLGLPLPQYFLSPNRAPCSLSLPSCLSDVRCLACSGSCCCHGREQMPGQFLPPVHDQPSLSSPVVCSRLGGRFPRSPSVPSPVPSLSCPFFADRGPATASSFCLPFSCSRASSFPSSTWPTVVLHTEACAKCTKPAFTKQPVTEPDTGEGAGVAFVLFEDVEGRQGTALHSAYELCCYRRSLDYAWRARPECRQPPLTMDQEDLRTQKEGMGAGTSSSIRLRLSASGEPQRLRSGVLLSLSHGCQGSPMLLGSRGPRYVV